MHSCWLGQSLAKLAKEAKEEIFRTCKECSQRARLVACETRPDGSLEKRYLCSSCGFTWAEVE